MRGATTSKWNLLLGMEEFTLDASNVKGFSSKFARSHPVWIGPNEFVIEVDKFQFVIGVDWPS